MITRLLDWALPQETMQSWVGSQQRRIRRWQWGSLRVRVELRPSSNVMGRFGAGWDWAVGIKASRYKQQGSVLLEVLVFMVMVSWGKP